MSICASAYFHALYAKPHLDGSYAKAYRLLLFQRGASVIVSNPRIQTPNVNKSKAPSFVGPKNLEKKVALNSKDVQKLVSRRNANGSNQKHASQSANETIRVGRWMSQAEYDAMKASGKVQESLSGTTHVASPADARAFINQATPGSIYVEFNVPVSSLKATNEGWSKILGPNSLEGRLAARKGLPIPQMPAATDIVRSATKLP